MNAHHTYRFQKTGRKLNVVGIDNHEFTVFDVVANHSPGQMEVFKTQVDDKSISTYDPGGLPFLLIPKAQITMQGTQVFCSCTSTFYPGSKLSEQLDHIFAGYVFLCLIDAHGKTSLCGFHQVALDSGQNELLKYFCQDGSYDYPRSSKMRSTCF